MKQGTSPTAVVFSLTVGAVLAFFITRVLGTDAPVLLGTAIGFGLGWAGSFFELRILRPYIRTDLHRAMRIVSGGFGVRVLLILIGMLILADIPAVHDSAFGIGVVAGFLAFLPVLADAVKQEPSNGGAHG